MGFLMRPGYVSPQEMCWRLQSDGARCVLGTWHQGECPPCVNREAYDRLCRLIEWEEPEG
jgi:hypothetical protein